ncbi:WD40 repeat domain-containing protein [Aeoliella mucimassa]|uniref:WD40 repeat domain-containing protein n=1 Tax=Aeoliella mucimassa TaxID=2527972 RepID=UPI0018D2822E|nr:WD40 repeat domain-containing protein [Aeoliella mucimassa]
MLFTPVDLPVVQVPEYVNANEIKQINSFALKGHSSTVQQVAFTVDSTHALTIDDDGHAVYRESSTGSEVLSWDLPKGKKVYDLDIAPDSKLAVTTHDDGECIVWDLATGEQVQSIRDETIPLPRCRFAEDPRYVVVGGADVQQRENHNRLHIKMYLYDLQTNTAVRNFASFDPKFDRSIHDASQFTLTTGSEPCEWLAQLGMMACFQSLRLESKEEGVWYVGRLRAGGMEFSDHVFDKPLGQPIDIAASTDDRHLVFMATDNGQIMAYNQKNQKRIGQHELSMETKCRDLQFLRGCNVMAIYDGDCSLTFYDYDVGGFTQKFPPQRTDVQLAVVSPDARKGISVYENGDIRLFELPPPAWSAELVIGYRLAQAESAWANSDFETLEKLADKFRERGSFDMMGFPMYWKLYQAVRQPEDTTSSGWRDHLAKFDAWLEAYPESSTARIGKAEALHAYAWVARGTGYIGSVTEEGYLQFKTRLIQAAELLLEAQERTGDDPALFELQIRIGQGLGLPKETLMMSFLAGRAVNEDYLPLYSSMGICLLPRWMGEPGDLAAFLQAEADKRDEEHGAMMYAWVFNQMKCFFDEGHLSSFGFDYERIHQGSVLLANKFTGTTMYPTLRAWTALRLSDRELARPALEKMGHQYYQNYFTDKKQLLRYRTWADASKVSERQLWDRLADARVLLSVAYSPEGDMIATGGTDRGHQIKLWDAATGDLKFELPVLTVVRSLDFHPTEGKLATVGGYDNAEGELYVWTLTDEGVEHAELDPPPGLLTVVRFSPDGNYLAVGSSEGEVWIWRKKEVGAGITKINIGAGVGDIDFFDDSKQLAISTQSHNCVANVDTGEVVHRIRFAGLNNCVSLEAMENNLLIGGQLSGIMGFSLQEKKFLPVLTAAWPENEYPLIARPELPVAEQFAIRSIDSSSKHRLIASTSERLTISHPEVDGHQISVFDADTRQQRCHLFGHCLRITDIRLSPDGTKLASVSLDGTLRVWNIEGQDDLQHAVELGKITLTPNEPTKPTEPVADEPPADEPPADEPPADEPPADEPPADEAANAETNAAEEAEPELQAEPDTEPAPE